MKVVLCICTCKRPQGLRRLLEGVAELDYDGDLSVVVVDNDVAVGAGMAVCKELADSGYRWPLLWVGEPQRGIPSARNRAVALALEQTPEFIAMLDDDERPCREWLRELLRIQSEQSADIVAGPVVPDFESRPPAWVVEGGFFERGLTRRDAERFNLYSTGNFIARSTCFEVLSPEPFDTSFGLSGSDDVLFFWRLKPHAFATHWSSRAKVVESIPPSRANWKWLIQRAFRVGNGHVRVQRALQPGALRESQRIIATSKSLMYAIMQLLMRKDRPSRIQAIMNVSKCIGKASGHLGFLYLEYRNTHGV